jgi:RNA polymerase sigma-70 factor (ECF subfamily)
MADEGFAAFLQRLRAGDEQAAIELDRQYGPLIRCEIRLRLTDPSVYRALDDEDICQSVLASFLIRARLGQYEVQDPGQLLHLLLGMARKKLAYATRRQHTQKRGAGRRTPETVDELPLAGDSATASRIAAGRELLQQVRERLSAEERAVADLRAEGHGWAEIAQQLGGTPDGRRMQLTRALDRVSRELGLDDDDE